MSLISKAIVFPAPKSSYTRDTVPVESAHLLYIPLVDSLTRRKTGEFTYAYLYCCEAKPRFLAIYAHGNAEDIGRTATDLRSVAQRSNGYILSFEYRGYGMNSASDPSEESTYQDALSAYEFARKTLGVPPQRLILIGRSLGTGVIAHLAAQIAEAETVALVVLQSAFTRIASCVESYIWNKLNFCGTRTNHSKPWIHINLGYGTMDLIDKITAPVAFHHGTEDELVPFYCSEQLITKRNASTGRRLESKLYADSGRGHNNLSSDLLITVLMDVMKDIPPTEMIFPENYLVNSASIREFFSLSRGKWYLEPLKTRPLKQYIHSLRGISKLLTLSVFLFALKCKKEWDKKCLQRPERTWWSISESDDHPNHTVNAVISECEKHCGSPIGVHVIVYEDPAKHENATLESLVFGARFSEDLNNQDPCLDMSAYLLDSTPLEVHPIDALPWTPELLASTAAVVLHRGTFKSEWEAIQSACEHLMTCKPVTWFQRMLGIQPHSNSTLPTPSYLLNLRHSLK